MFLPPVGARRWAARLGLGVFGPSWTRRSVLAELRDRVRAVELERADERGLLRCMPCGSETNGSLHDGWQELRRRS
jgi:hypothetical protein